MKIYERTVANGPGTHAAVGPEIPAAIVEHHRAREQAEAARVRATLRGWRETYQAERARLIGPDKLAQLNAFAADRRRVRPTDSGSDSAGMPAEEALRWRYDSFRLAERLGLDLQALARLGETADRVLAGVLRPSPRPLSGVGEFRVIGLGPASEPGPVPMPPSPSGASSAAIYQPPFAWWERSFRSDASGDGETMRNVSHLWPEIARMGSCVWSRNYDAGDFDYLVTERENGFMVPFTPTTTGVLEISFDVQSAFCQHRIWLYDEWGWSACHAWTNEDAVIAAFWDWDDYDPKSEVRDFQFVWGLEASGDGEDYPGTDTPVPAGRWRTVTLYSTMAFPAGVPIWLYVGTQQRISARLNDVSANLWVNSGWYLSAIRVRTV